MYFTSTDCTGSGVLAALAIDVSPLSCRTSIVRVGGTLVNRLVRIAQPLFFAQAQPFRSFSRRGAGNLFECVSTTSGPAGRYYEVAAEAVPTVDVNFGTVWVESR